MSEKKRGRPIKTEPLKIGSIVYSEQASREIRDMWARQKAGWRVNKKGKC